MTTLSVASKTFLVGEYCALKQGPALVLATEPRFSLHIQEGAFEMKGMHPQSPAGKFISKYQDFFANYQLSFEDPHQGMGGFGASGAQFILCAAFYYSQTQNKNINALDQKALLDEFHELAWDGKGYAPSGADIITQYNGNITFMHTPNWQIETIQWPFENICFGLIHTQKKIPTHEHLSKDLNFENTVFKEIVFKTYQALKDKDENIFCQQINAYADELARQNLVAKHTQELLLKFKSIPEVRAVKGCGALGADVIFFAYQRREKEVIAKFLQDLPVKLIALEGVCTAGIV